MKFKDLDARVLHFGLVRGRRSWKSASAWVPISCSLPLAGLTSPASTSPNAISHPRPETFRSVVCVPIYSTPLPLPFHSRASLLMWSTVLVCYGTDNTVRSISECHRVLKPGGELILGVTIDIVSFMPTQFLSTAFRGRLRRLGYRGLMSLIQSGDAGVKLVTLVKTYSRGQLRNILEDFRRVRFRIRHLRRTISALCVILSLHLWLSVLESMSAGTS